MNALMNAATKNVSFLTTLSQERCCANDIGQPWDTTRRYLHRQLTWILTYQLFILLKNFW